MSSFVNLIDQRRLIGPGGSTVGGEIFFYYTNTSVLAPISYDVGMTVPAPNPIAVGAGDIVPVLFLDGAITYRRVIVYADGTRDEIDPLNPIGGTGGEDLGVPIGGVIDFAGTTAPTGFFLCDGRSVSRTEYSALFAAIGTTYGPGDGTSTFALPDFRGRVGAGKDNMGGIDAGRLSLFSGTVLGSGSGDQSHTLTLAEIPSHNHTGTAASDGDHYHTTSGTNAASNGTAEVLAGAFGGGNNQQTPSNFRVTAYAGEHTHSITIDNAGSGDSHDNVQPTLIVNKIIKYSNTGTISLEAITAIAESAWNAAAQSQLSALASEVSALKSKGYADAAALAAVAVGIYGTTTEGIDNTVDGQSFYVTDGTDFALYKNNEGVADLLIALPTAADVNARVPFFTSLVAFKAQPVTNATATLVVDGAATLYGKSPYDESANPLAVESTETPGVWWVPQPAAGISTANGETVEQRLTSIDTDVDRALAGGGALWDNATLPLHIAHRGSELNFPENTLLAFDQAVLAGAEAVELDITFTAPDALGNKSLAVIHDLTTERTCWNNRGEKIIHNVRDLGKYDLYGIDASYRSETVPGFYDSGFVNNKIPLLSEVISLLRGRARMVFDVNGVDNPDQLACAQAAADMADEYGVTAAVLILCDAQDVLANGLDPKGCKVGIVNYNSGVPTTPTRMAELAAAGYYILFETKENITPTLVSQAHSAGLLIGGFTYHSMVYDDGTGNFVDYTVPDMLMSVDPFITQGMKLKSGQDYFQREYIGPGYMRAGFGSTPAGVTPIPYPKIIEIDGYRGVGWDSVHPSTPTNGRTSFGLFAVDPDPDNDGEYTLDFDWVLTEAGSTATEFNMLYFEMAHPLLMVESSVSSDQKEAYALGIRNSGAMALYKVSKPSGAPTQLATDATLPVGLTPNTRYPCRIVVTSVDITITFDVGGAGEKTIVSTDTEYRGNKYMQIQRRGHGFALLNLRAS